VRCLGLFFQIEREPEDSEARSSRSLTIQKQKGRNNQNLFQRKIRKDASFGVTTVMLNNLWKGYDCIEQTKY
jgi:hypothetical protein